MTEFLPDFALLRPKTASEAVAMHAAHDRGDGRVRYVAGGTDLLVNMRRGLGDPETLISLNDVSDISAIIENDDGTVTIGAGVSLASVTENGTIKRRYPAVAHAAHEIAGPGHRETGTVGGNLCLDTRCVFYNQSLWWRESNNYCLKYKGDTCHVAPKGEICHAAFSGDLAPVFLVMDAQIEVIGSKGPRLIPLADLYSGDGIEYLTLDKSEIVAAVHLPKDPDPTVYEKMRVRGAIDFPLCGVAVSLTKADGKVTSLKVAVTGTNTKPFIVEDVDDFVGAPFDEEAGNKLADLVQKQVSPMKTTLTLPFGRRRIAGALARRQAAALFNA
ncbi:MAG: 4-hydroxybenzoyl-CoA reductase subunit beta [Fimbriimonadaceae bacterium]|nr:4-hydroxybenzoyl-CoA reductase subunit beta [Alphaproteobacteria bacterium]